MSKVSNDPSGKPPSTGLFVGCFIDVATGVVRYSLSLNIFFRSQNLQKCSPVSPARVFPPSQYFCLHNFSPASPARVRRSSRGSRWSPAPSSSPASSSRHPAKMLCRSEDKRIKCFKIAPKRPLGWLCQKYECFLSDWQYSFTLHFPPCPISFLHVPLFIGLKVSHQ